MGAITFLNNYEGTAIGAVGVRTCTEVKKTGLELEYLTTSPNGAGFLSQVLFILRTDRFIVANLGLTSWGKSNLRNAIGFAAMGARAMLGRRTVVMLHHAIQVIAVPESGYDVSPLVLIGARLVLKFLKQCQVIVFSRELEAILKTRYRLPQVAFFPIPCTPVPDSPNPTLGAPKVIALGYIAPYKGWERLAYLPRMLPPTVTVMHVGGKHRILRDDPSYMRYTTELKRALEESGVRVLGYLSDSELSEQLAVSSVGVLPYTSTGGASASFAEMASYGLPIVATDLPEFRNLHSLGAGVVLTQGRAEAIATAVGRLLANPREWREMVDRQKLYASRYSWERFGLFLMDFVLSPGSK